MAKNQVTFENLSRAEERCLNLIQSLGIYELRAIARVFGDNSPTTSKRDDHIGFIMEKIIAGADLQPIPLRQGRPHKELSNIEGILEEISAIIGKDYTLKNLSNKNNDNLKDIGFKQIEEDVVRKKLFPILVKGVCLNHGANEFYLINEDNNLPILIQKKQFGKLEQFDFISGTAVIMNGNNDYILDSIDKVNFVGYDEYSPKIVVGERIMPSKKINFENKEITLGQRYLIREKLASQEVSNLVSSLQKNGIKCFALVVNAMFDDYFALSTSNFDNIFLLNFEDKPSECHKKINIFLNCIKRLEDLGNDVAIFVQDLVSLSHILDSFNKNSEKSYFNHTEETATTIKNIVMLAKSTTTVNSTIFVTNDDIDNTDLLYFTFVTKVSSKI